MRIRSIKPEFWRSTAISSLPIEDRLLFVGLWSYVDDNGVGIDRLALIAADLFADDLERDPSETFARVSRGILNLFERGRISRYTVNGEPYLSITNWMEHQRIDKPGKVRYPAPTTDDAVIRETVARVSRDSRSRSRGAGEQGSRGAGELAKTCASVASAPASREDTSDFDTWYSLYPKKRNRGAAVKAFPKALKKIALEELIEATERFASNPGEYQFIPYPASWLNSEGWADVAATSRQLAIAAPGVRRVATLGTTDWDSKMAQAKAQDAADEARRTA